MKTKLDNLYGHSKDNDQAIEAIETLVDNLETKSEEQATKITALESKTPKDWVELGKYSNKSLTNWEFTFTQAIADRIDIRPNTNLEIKVVMFNSRNKSIIYYGKVGTLDLNPNTRHYAQPWNIINLEDNTLIGTGMFYLNNYRVANFKYLPLAGATQPTNFTIVFYMRREQ